MFRDWLCLAVSLASLWCISLPSRADDLDSLIEHMRAMTVARALLAPDEGQKLVEEAHRIGAPAIPYLLTLLHNSDSAVRSLASQALSNIDGLTEEHLDALIEARNRDIKPLGVAISRIGTPKAIDYLASQFFTERDPGSDVDLGMRRLGKKAVPRLLQLYRSKEGWDDKLELAVNYTFTALGIEAEEAVDPLRRLALDESASEKMRLRAVSALGALDLAAKAATLDLQKLQHSENVHLQEAATKAILRTGAPDQSLILAQKLEKETLPSNQAWLIGSIASLQTYGRSAGPAVQKYLGSSDWEVRLLATQTLGDIDYRDGAAALLKQLHCQEDWRVVWSATVALGRLEAKQAVPALEKIAHDYWYPPVRAAALASLASIRTGEHPKLHSSNPFFFDDENVGRDMDVLTDEECASLVLPARYTEETIPKAIAAAAQENNIKGLRCGLPLEHGYLAGADRGEWGGEIVFFDAKYKPSVIRPENTQAIYQISKDQILALTGLVNTTNTGIIYQLHHDKVGRWSAIPWRTLPGESQFSRRLKGGSLFINCARGIVLVSPAGDLRSLTRQEVLSWPKNLR